MICDNAIFLRPDRCQQLQHYLDQWGRRIVLHFLPTYAPETNPIERLCNHRCANIEKLLDLVFQWLAAGDCFGVETSVYDTARTA